MTLQGQKLNFTAFTRKRFRLNHPKRACEIDALNRMPVN